MNQTHTCRESRRPHSNQPVHHTSLTNAQMHNQKAWGVLGVRAVQRIQPPREAEVASEEFVVVIYARAAEENQIKSNSRNESSQPIDTINRCNKHIATAPHVPWNSGCPSRFQGSLYPEWCTCRREKSNQIKSPIDSYNRAC